MWPPMQKPIAPSFPVQPFCVRRVATAARASAIIESASNEARPFIPISIPFAS